MDFEDTALIDNTDASLATGESSLISSNLANHDREIEQCAIDEIVSLPNYNDKLDNDRNMSNVEDISNHEDIIRKFGMNPMMDRIQQALYDQLMQTYYRVNGELKEKVEHMKHLKEKRERVGVELYTMQQQLAKLQTSLDKKQSQFLDVVEARIIGESELSKKKEKLIKIKHIRDEFMESHKKNVMELNALQDTLRQIEKYNEEMKNKILVNQRVTHKTESDLQSLEKEKLRQDMYIDGLMDQVKRLQEEVILQQARIEAQTENNQEAQDMIREAVKEMDSIQFEKRQLIQEWKSSLAGLARRDEALNATTTALREAEDASRDYDVEIDGLKKDLLKAQREYDALNLVNEKLENEKKYADEVLAKLKAKGEKFAESFLMLQRSNTEIEREEKQIDITHLQLKNEVASITQAIQNVTRERQKIETEAMLASHEFTSAGKAVGTLTKQIQHVIAQRHQKEVEEANIQNEVARLKMDLLNAETRNEELGFEREEVESELSKRESSVLKLEIDIKQRADELEKKLYRVNRLNVKYNSLVEKATAEEAAGVEDNAPLESTIRAITKQIDELRIEQGKLKHEWLCAQSTFISTTASTESIVEKIDELRAEIGVLNRRKMRLIGETETNQNEAKRLANSIEAIHVDMARLNKLIGKNGDQASILDNIASNMEQEYELELKSLEAISLANEEKIAAVGNAKNDLINEIVEAERQVLLWTRKIELEKETQEALDPQHGNAEIKKMEKEIHRMRLRLETLKREQEAMIVQMEQSIMKREQILVKYQVKAAAASNKPGFKDLSREALKKRITSCEKELQRFFNQTAQISEMISAKQLAWQEFSSELEKASSLHDELSGQREILQDKINKMLYEKQVHTCANASQNKICKRLRDVNRGATSIPDKKDHNRIQQSLLTSEAKLESVKQTIQEISQRHPHLEEILSRVLSLANSIEVQEYRDNQ